MKLSEFFDHLAYGELSQYGIGTDDAGKIAHKDFPRLSMLINLGLTRIYMKLPLDVKRIKLNVTEDVNTYPLPEDSILAVLDVTSDEGSLPVMLNNDFAKDTVSVSTKAVTFEEPIAGSYTVTYQRNHSRLLISKRMNPDEIELDIPEFIVEPLLTFCAAKVIGSGGNGESIQEGQMKLQEFEMLLQQIEDSGVVPEPTPTEQRHKPYGWV